ncbi:MAG: aminotransferase class I/II-fold pyridoxal phosphate-dependent enzyme [Granulosicoccus sp.]|nr:aminotransferase class I/II-fold pyridoxal phosphate-dependent enzyme [Granulosicoccus sp.]
MKISFTPLVESLPASTPFVGPETLERQIGKPFRARIGANESAFGISGMARQAITEALSDSGCSWYPDPENHELRLALAAKHGVAMDEICVDGGIDTLLGLTVRMLIAPGENVITSLGAYPTFNYQVAGHGGNLITVPYADNHEDPDALLAACQQHNGKLIYLSNPDNPMGTSHSAATIQSMIDRVPDGAVLALDEAYIDFTTDNLAPKLDTSNPKILRLRTFSKAYGMAGMRVGYIIAHKDVITSVNKIRNHFQINRLSQLAATASLADHAFLADVQKSVAERRQQVYALADEFGLPWLPSSTNFVAVDMGSSERAKATLKELGEHGIFMRMPGVAPLDRYIRVGLGTEDEHNYLTHVMREKLSTLADR